MQQGDGGNDAVGAVLRRHQMKPEKGSLQQGEGFMKNMRHWCLLFIILLGAASPAVAALEWNLRAELPLDGTPLEMALNPEDGRMFVLLEGGRLQVFAADGQLEEQFSVAAGASSMVLSPDGQRLFIGNAAAKTLQVVDISYIFDLPVGNSPIKGEKSAPVTLTVFDDFQCPYCARLVPLLDQLVAAYPGKVRLVFKHFPLRMHKFAEQAAIASLAAREQGKFWEMHDQLFANYNKLNETLINDLARKVGLDMKRFAKDMGNVTLSMEVAADMRLGQEAGVRGTPSLFINGKPAQERNLAALGQLIDRELAKGAGEQKD